MSCPLVFGTPDVPISGIGVSDWFHRRTHDGAVIGKRSTIRARHVKSGGIEDAGEGGPQRRARHSAANTLNGGPTTS